MDRCAPDILVMAKGIASGMPLSGIMAAATCSTDSAPGSHGGTYGGNAVACAAALATLDVIDDEGLLENARRQGERLLDDLRRPAGRASAVAEVRGRGLMVGIEFADGGRSPAARPGQGLIRGPSSEAAAAVCGTYGQVVRIIPPLVTTDDEVDSAIGHRRLAGGDPSLIGVLAGDIRGEDDLGRR